jgi:hypothetical protein
MLIAMRNVIEACVDDVDTSTFTSLDLEYVFLMLRSKSVGERIELNFECKADGCDKTIKTDLDVADIPVPVFDESSKTIELTDDVGVVLKFPSLVELQSLDDSLSEIDKLMTLIVSCVVSIYDENNVYDARDETQEAITNFVESLNSTQFQKLTAFFSGIPSLKHNIKLYRRYRIRRHTIFFYISLSHESLVNYYKTNFALMQHHNYSLTELDHMLPWEREIYISLLQDFIEEENKRLEANGAK